MDVVKIRDWAQNILDECGPLTPDPPKPIATPADLDAALASLPEGATLILSTSLVYPDPLVLTKAFVLQSETWETEQGHLMTVDEPAPSFRGGFSATVGDYQLKGLEIRQANPMTTIVVMGGMGAWLDRVRVLGDPVKGAHRGIEFRGGMGAITNSYVDDIFQPAQDTQAIYSQEMLPGGGLTITNCYLRAAGEVVMFGGGDSSSAETMPSNVTMADIVFDKRPEWLAMIGAGKMEMQAKGGFEAKALKGFRGSNLVFSHCAGISQGQGGYTLVFTPRNQGGKAPWSNVTDVIIDGFEIEGGSGVATFLGNDNNGPSGTMSDITLRNGVVTKLDRHAFDWNGVAQATGRVFAFDRQPKNITLDTIAVDGTDVKALGYFSGAAWAGFTAKNLTMPASTYGWKVDAGKSGHAALLAYMPDCQIDASVV